MIADELDEVLLQWVLAGADEDEVARRLAAIRAKFGEPSAPAPTPPTPSSPPPSPPSRVAIMDLSRPRLAPPPRAPWRDPEFAAEIARMKDEINSMFKEARDPFARAAREERVRDAAGTDATKQLGIHRKKEKGT
jgi:hypothetical protein